MVREENPESECGTISGPQKRRRNTSQSCLQPNDPSPTAQQPWFSSGLTLPVGTYQLLFCHTDAAAQVQTSKRAKVTESLNDVTSDISLDGVNTVCMPSIPTFKLLTTHSQMMVWL